MTMQGISLVTAKTDQVVSAKKTETSDSSFDSIMSKQSTERSNRVSLKSDSTDSTKKTSDASDPYKTVVSSKKGNDTGVQADADTAAQKAQPESKDTQPQPDMTEPDTSGAEAVVAQTMVFLQDMLGLTQEELQDVMDQASIQPQDLVMMSEDGTGLSVNTEAVKDLLLSVHGIEDSAVFLTNDTLNQELTEVTEQIMTAITEVTDAGQISGMEQSAPEADLAGDAIKEPVVSAAAVNPVLEENTEVQTENDTVSVTSAVEDTLTVTVENYTAESETDSGEQEEETLSSAQTEETQTSDSRADTVSAAETFKENLVQAYDEVGETSGMTTESTMNQIVEQVVRQVRIRVMPETTSMELQLNPASLGRVNLTVATTAAGVTTASLVVENQVAKEALESQMIQLKESFAQQGLKVDAVEVTVAEFGFKKEDGQQQEESSGGRRQNHRFRSDDELTEEEELGSDPATVSDRRDVNSMVDYTA